ncbi:MAG: hypothetical protein ACK2TS_03495, partial [Anaerolineales bacterium]
MPPAFINPSLLFSGSTSVSDNGLIRLSYDRFDLCESNVPSKGNWSGLFASTCCLSPTGSSLKGIRGVFLQVRFNFENYTKFPDFLWDIY